MLTPSKLVNEHTLSPRMVRIFSGLIPLLSTVSFAAAQEPPSRGDRRGPPPEAYTACEALNQNDVCSVVTPRETLSGSCQIDRRKKSVLICIPDNKNHRKKHDKRKREDNDSETEHNNDGHSTHEQ